MRRAQATVSSAHPAGLRHLATAALVLALAGLAGGPARAQPAAPAGAPPEAGLHTGPHAGPHGEAGPHGRGAHRMGPHRGADLPGGPLLSPRALADVGASAEQKARIREIFQTAHQAMRAEHEGGRELHQKMMALMTAPQIDAAAAEALRQQMQARREAGSKRMLQAMLDAQAVLTPEQRQKLAERMQARQKMHDRHPHDRHPHERRAPDAPRG